MADREWYEVPPGAERYPNFEEADKVAQEFAARTDREVEVCRCTETVVRRYKRQVAVVGEDVPTA